jgi:hypothetical protein
MRGHLLPFGDQADDLHLEIGERVPENPGNITGRRRAVDVERKHVEEAGMARVRLRDIVNSADRAAQHGDLVPTHQQFRVFDTDERPSRTSQPQTRMKMR